MVVYRHSDLTGWLIAVVISDNELLSPVLSFIKSIFAIAVIILMLALVFSFFAARKYTHPISKLYTSIKSMDLQIPLPPLHQELNSGLDELEELNYAFQKMSIKIKKSVEDLLMAQQNELHSKMLALQSQMNPHFLYNTLATISAMSEENMNQEIIKLSGYVADLLRYISSDKSPMAVKIRTEIDYTKNICRVCNLDMGKNYYMKLKSMIS